MGLFSRKEEVQTVQAVTVQQPVEELPFLLQPGERLEASAMNIQYRGPIMITFTSGGGGHGDVLFGGFATSKTQKRENSVWDAKTTDLYLTNQRMVLTQHGRKGGLAGDIPLKAIQALSAGKFMSGFNIQFSVPSAQGVDNASMVFIAKLHGEDRMREAERDRIFARIKDLREAAVKAAAVPAAPVGEDPMQRLKMRLVNGEISPAQYEEMRRLLT